MKYCKNCATENPDGANRCQNCGELLEGAMDHMAANGYGNSVPYGTAYNYAPKVVIIPEENRALSMWEYLLYQILFSLPTIGFIITLVFCFGGTKNINLKNFARSFLCLYLLCVILVVVVFILALSGMINP